MEPLRAERPIADRTHAAVRSARSRVSRAETLVLLVDRGADSPSAYAAHLASNGYAVEEAIDGREALAKALARRPDLVVADTRVAGIDGYDLCQLLRNDPVTHAVPIVLLTSEATETALSRGRIVGADAVLTTPCAPDVLLGDVQRLLARPDRGIAGREAAQRSDAVRGDSGRGDSGRLSHEHRRYATTQPPLTPPALMCPTCDSPLVYDRSHIGGVSERHREQWDDFRCPAGCGEFQYRHRTRKLRASR
jgi:CheY-like chemotaxis protein